MLVGNDLTGAPDIVVPLVGRVRHMSDTVGVRRILGVTLTGNIAIIHAFGRSDSHYAK